MVLDQASKGTVPCLHLYKCNRDNLIISVFALVGNVSQDFANKIINVTKQECKDVSEMISPSRNNTC